MPAITQTYTFEQAIDILTEIKTHEELEILTSVIQEEEGTYTLVELRVFKMLFRIYKGLF